MKRSANYETDNGVITVRPNMVDQEAGEQLMGYITIFTTTSKIHVNREYVKELREILEAIEERYINQ